MNKAVQRTFTASPLVNAVSKLARHSPALNSITPSQPECTIRSSSTPYPRRNFSRNAGADCYVNPNVDGRRLFSSAFPVHQDASVAERSYGTVAIAPEEPIIHDVYESVTGTWQYVVADPSTLTAVIIDPVLDYDPATQVVRTTSADALLSLTTEKGYKIDRILETHAHADHLTAASYLQRRIAEEQGHRPRVGIGKRIGKVQDLFSQKYGIPQEEYQNVFDDLFNDDEVFEIGNLKASAIHLPGHTPDHLGYRIGDNVFVGDSIFHVDIGSARCDFPGGSADKLYNSAQKLLQLPGHVKIWTGHDYPSKDRDTPVSCMTVEDHKRLNKHFMDGITADHFVSLRNERDAGLAAPKLIDPSLQMNIRAGRLPKPAPAGQMLLHLPLKVQDIKW